MKIKSLLIGMLACTALVGCTDDDVLGGGENQKAVKMDTYISLSINSNTNSSRSTGDGYGDNDGSVETSGHLADAARTENNVNSVLVIVTPTNESEAVNPEVNNKPTINGLVKLLEAGEFSTGDNTTTSEKTISMNPERVDYIQEYKAIVVVNPVTDLLKTKLGYNATTKAFTKNHREAYAVVQNYSGQGYENIGTEKEPNWSFMMANQSEVTFTPTEENQIETNPKKASINVERAVSKVTFRPVLNGEGADDDNSYNIEVKETNYVADAARKWYVTKYTVPVKDAEGQVVKNEDGTDKTEEVEKYTYAWFNKAYITGRIEPVWVLLTNASVYEGGQVIPDDVVGFFEQKYKTLQDGSKEAMEYTGYVEITANAQIPEEAFEGNATAALLEAITLPEGETKQSYLNKLKFEIKGTPSTTKKNYTIKLTKYALTNMSNNVYAVRHKVGGTTIPCGILADTDCLADPYTTDKATQTAYSTWFESATLFSTIQTAAVDFNVENWQDLPTSKGYYSEDNTVSSAHGSVTDAGHLLRYCYENSVQVANVNDNLISGIVFVGQIMDGNTAVPVLYKYKGKFFRTLKELLAENSKLAISENSDETAIKATGIEIYEDGQCYYYAGIKHKDNALNDYNYTDANVKTYDLTNGGVGNMEFAIMRNNIYSLAISGINQIGASTLKLTAGSNVADQSAFITVECTIKPWIVRFNDIQF